MTCDILFENARVFNTAYRRFFEGFLAVEGERVVRIGTGKAPASIAAKLQVDLGGRYVVPGLIDVHMHIESSMLTPAAYAAEAVRHGVTTVVSEPHEIANVAGLSGVRALMEAGKGAPIDIYYGIPSCVPSTSDALETSGGEIGEAELLELLACPEVKCLGEVMNTASVLREPDGKANRLVRAFRAAAPLLPAEGHVPRIVDDELAQYLMSGVDSDHTEHTLEELRQRWFNGMFVELQEKTLSREALAHLAQNALQDSTALVTDDVMADEMVDHGVLDHVLRRAVQLGLPVEDAVYCSTHTPARRMLLFDRGALRPGLLADFVILDDADSFDIYATYKRGRCAFQKGDARPAAPDTGSFPAALLDSVKLAPLYESDFALHTEREGIVACRAAQVDPHRTQTAEVERKLEATDGELLFEDAGVCQYAVFERHGKNGNRGQGLVCGCTLTRGAAATTYSHDSHNLCVLGTNKADMAAAANTVIAMKGGIAVVENGSVVASAALPVGGILSQLPAQELAKQIGSVTEALRRRGYDHEDPIMSFCVLALPVSPQLKITDRGPVDVTRQERVSLEK